MTDDTRPIDDAARLRPALSALFGEIADEALDDIVAAGKWVDVEAGRRLMFRGAPANALYVLIRGRLRASIPTDEGPRVIGEVAAGETVGEMALLGGGRRNADIDALRDSRLLRLDVDTFRALAGRHPEFLWNLARLVVRRASGPGGANGRVPRVRTVAIASVGPAEHRARFVERFGEALRAHGSVQVLGPREARQVGGDDDRSRWASWLDRHEAGSRFVLLLTDDEPDDWSRFVLRQADRVLVVAPATEDPDSPAVARWTVTDADREVDVRRDLVLVHADGSTEPSGTDRWLDRHRPGRAHHVRDDRRDDHERLARFVAGRAVALVFAGGGAKGFAHVGVLRVLREQEIPIDLVGGTSIGAILAATVARDWDDATRMRTLRAAFVSTNPASDWQIPPLAAMVQGRKMERLLRRFLGGTDIADLWIPFFCVTSNMTMSEPAIHTRGPLWKSLRATASIAGVFPPVVFDGHLHVDGGTFDNLPVETARGLDAGHVVACDIDRSTHRRVDFDHVPSGGALLVDRLLRRRRYRVPGIMTTMMQTTFLAGLDRAKTSADDADVFFSPMTRGVRFLDWSALERAADLGERDARQRLDDPEFRARLSALRSPGIPRAVDHEPV